MKNNNDYLCPVCSGYNVEVLFTSIICHDCDEPVINNNKNSVDQSWISMSPELKLSTVQYWMLSGETVRLELGSSAWRDFKSIRGTLKPSMRSSFFPKWQAGYTSVIKSWINMGAAIKILDDEEN